MARAALRLLDGAYGKRVVVIAGPGNNGADGRAAARRLARRGVRCQVLDAAALPERLPTVDLVIDAGFGTGFRGTFEAPALADPSTPVLAVDIPSGVSGSTGVAAGRPLRAAATVTFAALKPGLLLADGPDLAGVVEVADIGLDTSSAGAHRIEADDVAGWLPVRPRAAHKWRTALWLVAGSPGMTGAAHLAARSAQRAGAGYVRLSVPGAGTSVQAPLEAVVVPLAADGWHDEVRGAADRFTALAVGPGLGRGASTTQEVRRLVGRDDPADRGRRRRPPALGRSSGRGHRRPTISRGHRDPHPPRRRVRVPGRAPTACRSFRGRARAGGSPGGDRAGEGSDDDRRPPGRSAAGIDDRRCPPGQRREPATCSPV